MEKIQLCVTYLDGYPQHVAVFESTEHPENFERFAYALLKALDPKARADNAAFTVNQAEYKSFDEYVFAKYYMLHNCSPSLSIKTILMFIYSGLTEEYQRMIQPKVTDGTITTLGDLVRAGRSYKDERERQLNDICKMLDRANDPQPPTEKQQRQKHNYV